MEECNRISELPTVLPLLLFRHRERSTGIKDESEALDVHHSPSLIQSHSSTFLTMAQIENDQFQGQLLTGGGTPGAAITGNGPLIGGVQAVRRARVA